MKHKSSIIALCAFLVLAVSASAEPFKIRNADLPELAAAIIALDGTDRAVDQGPGNPARILREPYKFAGDVRARLAANLAVLAAAGKDANDQRDALIRQISGGGSSIDQKDKAKLDEFNRAAQLLFEKERTLDLSPIATADLQLDQNAIPVSVLAVLAKLRTPSKP